MEVIIVLGIGVIIALNTAILCVLLLRRKSAPLQHEAIAPTGTSHIVINVQGASVPIVEGAASLTRTGQEAAQKPDGGSEPESDSAIREDKAARIDEMNDEKSDEEKTQSGKSTASKRKVPEPVYPEPMLPKDEEAPPPPPRKETAIAAAIVCPNCKKENSVFRDTCFNCGVPLPKS